MVLEYGLRVILVHQVDVRQDMVDACQGMQFLIVYLVQVVRVILEQFDIVLLDRQGLIAREMEDGGDRLGAFAQERDFLRYLQREFELVESGGYVLQMGLTQHGYDGAYEIPEFRGLVDFQQLGDMLEVAPRETVVVVLIDMVDHEGGGDQ